MHQLFGQSLREPESVERLRKVVTSSQHPLCGVRESGFLLTLKGFLEAPWRIVRTNVVLKFRTKQMLF
jgi:hypothetical protein